MTKLTDMIQVKTSFDPLNTSPPKDVLTIVVIYLCKKNFHMCLGMDRCMYAFLQVGKVDR